MNLTRCVLAAESPAGSSVIRPAGTRALARRVAKLAVVATIATAFVEVALDPAASFSAIHFWLALFLAAAVRREKDGAACRS